MKRYEIHPETQPVSNRLDRRVQRSFVFFHVVVAGD